MDIKLDGKTVDGESMDYVAFEDLGVGNVFVILGRESEGPYVTCDDDGYATRLDGGLYDDMLSSTPCVPVKITAVELVTR